MPSDLALKALQVERPAYAKGAEEWWAEVIRRTALGAGASSDGESVRFLICLLLLIFTCLALAKSLPEIVPTLLHRFSSKEGYAFYDDAVPTSAFGFPLPMKCTETGLSFQFELFNELAFKSA
jgi:hypothetical protein